MIQVLTEGGPALIARRSMSAATLVLQRLLLPKDVPSNATVTMRLFYDLMHLAPQTDSTRVSTATAAGKPVRKLTGHTANVCSVAFTPDGKDFGVRQLGSQGPVMGRGRGQGAGKVARSSRRGVVCGGGRRRPIPGIGKLRCYRTGLGNALIGGYHTKRRA